MAKRTKKDLLKIINEINNIDEDVKISLMEDVEDSFEGSDTSELEQQIEDLQTQNEELKQKYKDRFLKGNDVDIDNNKKKDGLNEGDEDEPEQPKKFEDLFDEKGELK